MFNVMVTNFKVDNNIVSQPIRGGGAEVHQWAGPPRVTLAMQLADKYVDLDQVSGTVGTEVVVLTKEEYMKLKITHEILSE